MIVESIKEEKIYIYICIYSLFISGGWEKYGGFAKKAKLSLKKGKKTYMWRWCRSSVRNQSVASLIRNAIGISSVRAMPDPHQLVSNRNRSSSVSNFHDDSPFNARFSAIFFIYLARLIQINQSVKKLNGKFSRNNCARRIFVSITLYFDHKLKKKKIKN